MGNWLYWKEFGNGFGVPMSRGGGAASSFSPTNISGLRLWYKADAGLFKDSAKTQPATANGDIIYTWADQSGNSNDVTQSASAKRPLFQTSVINGLPVARFNGVDGSMSESTDTTIKTLAAWTIFAVIRPNISSGADQSYNSLAGMSSGSSIAVIGGNTGVLAGEDFTLFGGARRLGTSTTSYSWSASVPQIVEFFSGSNSNSLLVNGVQKTLDLSDGTSTSATPFTPAAYSVTSDTLEVGGTGVGTGNYKGDMAEFLLYNTLLSSGDRTLVRNYLNSKWSVY